SEVGKIAVRCSLGYLPSRVVVPAAVTAAERTAASGQATRHCPIPRRCLTISRFSMSDDRLVTAWRVAEEVQYEGGRRPRGLHEYSGQDRTRENLQASITAARQRSEALDHVLLYGPPGLGKTTLAYVIANELGVPIRSTAGPVIEKPGDLAAMLSNLQERE